MKYFVSLTWVFVLSLTVEAVAQLTTQSIQGLKTNSESIPRNMVMIETFESPGADLLYDLKVIEDGNDLIPDFPTINLGVDGWGEECLGVRIGPSMGGAFVMRNTDNDGQNGYFTHASVIVAESNMEVNRGDTVLITKPGDGRGSVAAWRLLINRWGEDLIWLLAINDTRLHYQVGPIVLGRVYEHNIMYDLKSRTYAWFVNDPLIAYDSMTPDFPQTNAKVIGTSGSSDGRNILYFIDNVVWIPVP